MTDKLTGGNTNYYLAEIEYPKRGSAYTAECEDIITALKMTFAEGCAFKAIWRSASARLGNGKPGADAFGIYDGEKINHYGKRILVERHIAQDAAIEKSKVPFFPQHVVIKTPDQPPGLAAYNTTAVGSCGGDLPEDFVPGQLEAISSDLPPQTPKV